MQQHSCLLPQILRCASGAAAAAATLQLYVAVAAWAWAVQRQQGFQILAVLVQLELLGQGCREGLQWRAVRQHLQDQQQQQR